MSKICLKEETTRSLKNSIIPVFQSLALISQPFRLSHKAGYYRLTTPPSTFFLRLFDFFLSYKIFTGQLIIKQVKDPDNPVSLFKSWGKTPKFAIFKSESDRGVFSCLFSSMTKYSTGNYSIYEIPEVLRLIGKRVELFTTGLQEELSKDQTGLPIVLVWEKEERNILIIDLASVELSFEQLELRVSEIKDDILIWSHNYSNLTSEHPT
jgi:hypothetical protein